MSNISEPTLITDEFGRDVSLRNYYKTRITSLKIDSWADYEYELEEAEEAAKKRKQEIALKILILDRKLLYLYGKYELEEGEILG